MTTPLAAFPNVERAVCELLEGLGTVGTETNADLQDSLPFILVAVVGGSDNRISDLPRVDVRVYAAGATQAKTIAETARQRLIAGPHATTHGVLDKARTEVRPQILPYEDSENLRLVVATYRISLRRR
jgi:hypothetical protein